MTESSWPAQLEAWSAFAAAVFTFVLVLMAALAWRTAKRTLDAAKDANDQARLDSLEQTRPYVYAEVVPSLVGVGNWDVRIANVGKSSARGLSLAYDQWPKMSDDVAESVGQLFNTPRTLPPSCSIRAVWRLEGNFTDGTTEAGMGKAGKLAVTYTSDDPSHPQYADTFDVMIERSGLWPVGEHGPDVEGLHGDQRKFYLLGQALVHRIAELNR